MIIEVIIISLMLLCALTKKDKVVFWSFASIMIILMMYTTFNADYYAYLGRYMNFILPSQIFTTDPAFGTLMYFCKQIGLSYAGFLGVVSFLGLCIVFYVYNKYSTISCIHLIIYFILFYSTHTIQLRSFLAEWITVVAVLFFLNNNEKNVKYVLLILLASAFHFSALFYLFMLMPQYVKKTTTLCVITGVLAFVFPYLSDIVYQISYLNAQMKMDAYLSEANERFGLSSVVFIFLFIFLTLFTAYLSKRNFKKGNEVLGEKFLLITKYNIITWISLGLIVMYSNNFFRINRPMIIVSLLYILNYYFVYKVRSIQFTTLAFSFIIVVIFIVTELMTHKWYDNIQLNLLFQQMNLL